MLTVKDHNDRAAPAYAAHPGEYWIESLKDGRHVLIRALAAKDREREYAFIKTLVARVPTPALSRADR